MSMNAPTTRVGKTLTVWTPVEVIHADATVVMSWTILGRNAVSEKN